VVLLFLGFTGAAFNRESQGRLERGDTMAVGDYRLVYEGHSETRNPLTIVIQSQLGVYRDARRLGTMWPEQRIYYKRQDNQRTSEVAIRSALHEDLYVLYEGHNQQGTAFFRAYVNPLVMWIWIGSIVITVGTIIAMWPDRREKLRRVRIGGAHTEHAVEERA
jgi:cytochrome c-type biogenesis protein CcmF